MFRFVNNVPPVLAFIRSLPRHGIEQPAASRQQGTTYLAVMFAVFLIVLATSAAAVVWQVEVRRSKEQELLFDGEQFAHALATYQLRHASSPTPFPKKLTDLLGDGSGLVMSRDLRRIWVDPYTASNDWGLLRLPDGEIVGVYSRSSLAPIQKSNFPIGLDGFSTAKHYSDWVFRAMLPPVEIDPNANQVPDPTAPRPAPMLRGRI